MTNPGVQEALNATHLNIEPPHPAVSDANQACQAKSVILYELLKKRFSDRELHRGKNKQIIKLMRLFSCQTISN